MDFEKVLHKAQKNEKKKAKEPMNYYRTSFSPPKKEEKTRGLSANIQKFLARREQDERKKKITEDKKKEELLALRNQDNKAKKRVQVMLKRTKSANKSVLDDAIDTVNTADTLNGPQQCDEDDYGYVSQEASKFYKQMMEKYSSVPVEEKKFSKPNNRATAKDLVNTKDRVKQALLRQEEEEHMPHKRKRRHKDKDDDDNEGNRSRSNSPEKIEEPEKPKPKRPAMPPPLDFSALLKIAEKKQHEPVVIEKKIVKKEKEEPERLMTKKEKMEYEKQRERVKKIAEYGKPSSSKPVSDDSPRSSYDSREPSNSRGKETARPDTSKHHQREVEEMKRIDKLSESKSREKERLREKERGLSNSTIDRKRTEENNRPLQKSHYSNMKGNGSHSRNSPQTNNMSPSRSRSRSPHSSRDRMLSNGHTGKDKFHNKSSGSPSVDRLSSSSTRIKDDMRRNNPPLNDAKPSSLPRIPKISRTNEEDRRVEGKYADKYSTRDKEKVRDREKEKERDREKEKERDREKEKERERQRERERERAKEKERDRVKERDRDRERERDKERQRLREKEMQLEREKEKLLEMQRELEREREKARERERMKKREPEKERERRERDCRENSLKRPYISSEKEKPKLVDIKKSAKYDKRDLFGDRDSASPETVPTRHKTSDDSKKVKIERIKIVENSTSDLFDNPVTIVRKQSQNDRNREKASILKPSSTKPDDKSKPSSSSSSSRSTSSLKNPSDKEKARTLNHNDRKREAEDARYPPDKRPRLDIQSSNKPQATKDTFKKPLPPKQFPPNDLKPKEFPPRDLQRKQFPPRDLQRKRFPPSDLKSRKFPPSDVRRGSVPRKRFEYERSDSEDSDEDEEEEYASDLDDFIDDGPAEDEEDYSKYIKDIFGYDKSKYRDDDEDIEESSFAEQMREECRSARLGLIEDLEDMAMEQREKRHKAIMRMKRGRR